MNKNSIATKIIVYASTGALVLGAICVVWVSLVLAMIYFEIDFKSWDLMYLGIAIILIGGWWCPRRLSFK